MATFRRVADFFLRKVGENSFVGKNNYLLLCRNGTVKGRTALQVQNRTKSSKSEAIRKDEPIAYSKSPAQHHKVNDTLQYDSKKLNITRTFVICFGLFSFIIYYGFIREESQAERKIFELNEMQNNPGETSSEENLAHDEIVKK